MFKCNVSLTDIKTVLASRQVLDKSYYVSLLRQKSNSLISEIESLKKELDRGERDRQNLMIYEKRAEEEASTIRDLQGRLIDCNMILDRLNTNSDLGELEEELNELIAKNEEAEKSLNELFADRQRTEQSIREVEKQIEIEKGKNATAISDMDITVRNQFEELKQQAMNVNEELRMKQEELTELNRRKEQLDDEVANSTLKQQAMKAHFTKIFFSSVMLQERLAEIQAKKATIVEEMNAEGTPDQQREWLLQTVIRTTDEVAAVQKQIDTLTERIDQGNEELREFENEYDGIIGMLRFWKIVLIHDFSQLSVCSSGEKNEKYRELKMKEIQIDEFLNSFEQLKSEQEGRIAQSSAEIVRFLEIISHNSFKTDITANVTGMDTSGIDAFNDQSACATELQDLHVRLQEEMFNVDESERRLKEDVENFSRRMQEMNDEMKKFEDHETLKAGTEQKRQELEKRSEELQAVLPDTKRYCEEVLGKLAELQAQLDDSDEYTTALGEISSISRMRSGNPNVSQLKNVQKKWQYVEQNNAALREAAAAKDAETNYTKLKDEAMRLQAEYNASLVSWTRPR
ncbi:unnamed protein product [Toxocara canis]|uniref:Intraflagellar transport protein 74 homolog n=1 Tax=Toxocara canis TaxID=6265 RepID=A0A183TZT1_TOXCA|nr:unnamed protein product [Toxocara canis]